MTEQICAYEFARTMCLLEEIIDEVDPTIGGYAINSMARYTETMREFSGQIAIMRTRFEGKIETKRKLIAIVAARNWKRVVEIFDEIKVNADEIDTLVEIFILLEEIVLEAMAKTEYKEKMPQIRNEIASKTKQKRHAKLAMSILSEYQLSTIEEMDTLLENVRNLAKSILKE